jgi:hypothetical protein
MIGQSKVFTSSYIATSKTLHGRKHEKIGFVF